MPASQAEAFGELLRPAAVQARGRLSHAYLENVLLALAEAGVDRWLREQPEREGEIGALLRFYVDGFAGAYDPNVFVTELQSLQRLEESLRERVRAAVRREYEVRFRPAERHADLESRAEAFLRAYGAWRAACGPTGPSAASTDQWTVLQERARDLHRFLDDSELKKRWIP